MFVIAAFVVVSVVRVTMGSFAVVAIAVHVDACLSVPVPFALDRSTIPHILGFLVTYVCVSWVVVGVVVVVVVVAVIISLALDFVLVMKMMHATTLF